jgi:succinoglycan biosynthesis transport protein ExoP
VTNDDKTLLDLMRILRKRARAATIAAFAVLLAMTCLVFLLPAVYEATATLLIKELELPAEVTGDLSTQQYVEQRLQRTRQQVLTNASVQDVIKRLKVFDVGDDPAALQEATTIFHASVLIIPQVTGVIDPRTMRAAELTYAFNVGFRHSDPAIAASVANELSELFISSSATQARQDAANAIEFAKNEAERLAGLLREREARLTEFREMNPGGLPDDRVRNQDRAIVLERELAAIDADLRAARGRRELLEGQMLQTPRDNFMIGEGGEVVLGGADRLVAAQQELVAALAKYSENHPDVRRLRREIASLKSEVGSQTQSAPTNPAYVQLQTQASSANIEITELSRRRSSVASQLAALQGEITMSPRLEEEHRELVRDYEVIRTQYEQLRGRQASAELQAKAAEGSAVAESYVLINPAQVPDSPVEPDRIALMFLSFVLAIATGLGTAFLMHVADSTVRGSSDVALITGAEPIAHIPMMQNSSVSRRRRFSDFALAGAIVVVAIIMLYIVT